MSHSALVKQCTIGVVVNVDKYVHLKKRYVPPYVHLDVSVQMDYSKLRTTDALNRKTVILNVSQVASTS